MPLDNIFQSQRGDFLNCRNAVVVRAAGKLRNGEKAIAGEKNSIFFNEYADSIVAMTWR